MPVSAPRPCPRAGCNRLISGRQRYCSDCQRIYERQKDEHRPNSHQRGYDRQWRKASKDYLERNPLCECPECKDPNTGEQIRLWSAEVVDHIKPHRGDMRKFWDEDNWQAMAKTCHDKKTAREDGGFGNTGARR
jgi:5-methylcytosine-specific restriction protein A